MTGASTDRGWTVFILPSSHNDIGWAGTPSEIAEHRASAIVDVVLSMMDRDPDYTFAMEAALYLHEYLDRRPERVAHLRQYVDEGRLEWGASYIQPYEGLLGGESLLRQLYWGRRWMHRQLGIDASGYWNIDVEGRTIQVPQLLAQAGVRYMVLSRNEPGLYWWEAPDGSRVLVLSLMEGAYGRAAVLNTQRMHLSPLEAGHVHGEVAPISLDSIARELVPLLQRWEPFFATHHLPRYFLIAATADYTVPDERLQALVQQWNAAVDTGTLSLPTPVHLRFGNAAQYVAALQAHSDLAHVPTVRGELPNPWVYIHGPCHHKTVAALRAAAAALLMAEAFTAAGTIAGSTSACDIPDTRPDLARAWTDHLYPDHGYGGLHGEGTDEIFRAKEESAWFTARRIARRAMADIAGAIARPPTDSEGAVPSLVVFNALSWPRTDWVEADIFFSSENVGPAVRLVDAVGQPVAMQVLGLVRTPDGRLRRLRLGFIAPDVPALGYRAFYLRSSAGDPPSELTPLETLIPADYDWENDDQRVRVTRGGLVEWHDKRQRRNLLAADHYLGGEIVEFGSPGHDVGEGERDITTFDWRAVRPFQPTPHGLERTADRADAIRLVENGPLRYRVTTTSAFSHATIRQSFAFYRDLDRIDIGVDVENWSGAHGRELRLLFPLASQQAAISYDVPFGHVRAGQDEVAGFAGLRPREVQSWIHADGDGQGVTLSSSVIAHDWVDPLAETERPVLQAILLATKRSCHPKGPWYTQEGTHAFAASVTAHARSLTERTRFGLERQQPLEVLVHGQGASSAASAASPAPPSRGFLTVEPENVIVTALKCSDDGDGVIVRCRELTGAATEATLRLSIPVRAASRCTILEESGDEESAELVVSDDQPTGTLTLPLRAFEIATVKVTV